MDVGLNFLPFGCNMWSTRWTAKALLFTYLVNQWAALHCVCEDLLQQSCSTDWADAAIVVARKSEDENKVLGKSSPAGLSQK